MSVVLAALVISACGGDGGGESTTTLPGDPTFDGVTFSISEADNGKRLRIRIGDEVVARLAIANRGAPAWEISKAPEPRVLTVGDRLRFIPSEFEDAAPYDEITFRAVGEGNETIVITQSGTSASVTFTVIVEPR
jgi:hypothetical protein